jgi:hypothetical protein
MFVRGGGRNRSRSRVCNCRHNRRGGGVAESCRTLGGAWRPQSDRAPPAAAKPNQRSCRQSPRHPPVQSPNSLRLLHSHRTFRSKHPRTPYKQPAPSPRLQSHENKRTHPHHGRRRPQPVRRNRNRRLLLRRDAADLPPPVPLRRSLRDQHFRYARRRGYCEVSELQSYD